VKAVASVAALKAEATYAAERLALYRRRILMGRGDPRTLAERERAAESAAERLRRARHPPT
jgi:hypothetical protein